jgi:hypothetical protein
VRPLLASVLALLRWLFPFRWLFCAIVLLAGTGFLLQGTPRFSGLAWGLTEIAHVWTGWAAVGLASGYVTWHLFHRWGSFRSAQRLLGLLTLSALLTLLGTGALLGLGMRGGPPPWARPIHSVTTWVLLAGIVAHGFAAWRRWPGRLRRRVLEGP